MSWHFPPILRDGRIALRSLAPSHVPGLLQAGEPDLFKYLSRWPREWAQPALAQLLDTLMRDPCSAFYVVLDENERECGMTAFLDISENNRRLEIGWTWYGRPWQGTGLNKRVKYLMLLHAFESLGASRVCLTCDQRNERSRRAITSLGATEEGVMRQYGRMPDGWQRDVVVFSIIRQDWPAVADSLRRAISVGK